MSQIWTNYDRFLFTADCHIKRRTWTNSALLQDDALESLSSLVEAVKDRTDTILIGGDLFDTNRPTSKYLIDTIFYLRYKFQFIHYIRGNHDSVTPPFLSAINENDADIALEIHEPNPLFLQQPAQDIGPLFRTSNEAYILGVPYMNSTSDLVGYMQYYVNQWRKFRVDDTKPLYLMLHTSFQHLLGFDGAYQLTVDDIKNICGNDKVYVLAGHIHTRDTTVYNEAGAYIHSPGSLYPLSSDAMGTPCFGSLIQFATGEIEDIPCDVRKYVDINASDIPDCLHLESWLSQQGYEPDFDRYTLPTFVRITVPDDFDGKVTGINNDKFVTLIISKASIKAAQSLQSKSYTLQEAVAEELTAEQNSEMLQDMANALLLSDDQVALLDEWLAAWGVRKAT